MKPYRGIVCIECTAKKCPEKRVDVQPACGACPSGLLKIIDLENKPLFETRALAPLRSRFERKSAGNSKKENLK